MVVIVLENASDSLRGELSKWLLEVKPGVLVADISKRVREELWKRVVQEGISALMIYSYNNEQGFNIEMVGEPYRSVVSVDGIVLIAKSRRYEGVSNVR